MDSLIDEVLDISNPEQLRRLLQGGESPSTPLISEFDGNPDSDVEDDEFEVPTKQRGAAPIHRDSVFLDDEEPSTSSTNNTTTTTTTTNDNNNNWRMDCTAPSPLPFTGNQGLQVEVSEDASPMDFLKLLITDDMMDSIVVETNRYATETVAAKDLSPHSRFRRWTAVSRDEMWSFFGVIIMMGLIVIDDMEDYWNIDHLFSLPFFRAVMRRERFCLILSFLHLCDNSQAIPRNATGHNPLFKIFDFIRDLTKNFQDTYLPGKHIAVDEAMVAWRGPLAFRVYNPDKPDKFGIKIFELCDSQNGYCCNLEVYSGKKECSTNGATFDVVERLTSLYQGCGRVLFVDNYYTSPDLFTHLKNHQTLACGTMRLNRRNGPPKNMIPKLARTDPTTYTITNGILNLIRFFDKREVNMLTTAYNNTTMATGKTNPATKEPVVKLTAVHNYNKFMGAVDRSDQMVANHAFKRRTLKWWKKAFFHMFMLGILNSYILFKTKAAKKLSHSFFRRVLVKQLVQFTPMLISPHIRQCDIGGSSLFRLTARHFICTIEPKPGQKKKHPQRQCEVCSEPTARKWTRTECRDCNVGLHMTCFVIYHTKKDYKRAAKRRLQDALDSPSSGV